MWFGHLAVEHDPFHSLDKKRLRSQKSIVQPHTEHNWAAQMRSETTRRHNRYMLFGLLPAGHDPFRKSRTRQESSWGLCIFRPHTLYML